MESIKPCPVCGQSPDLLQVDQEKKFLCSVHVSAGNWEETEEAAIASWNERVAECERFERAVQEVGSPEYVYAAAKQLHSCHCKGCEYRMDLTPLKELIYQISMTGGYVRSDRNGGYLTRCPDCGERTLQLKNESTNR